MKLQAATRLLAATAVFTLIAIASCLGLAQSKTSSTQTVAQSETSMSTQTLAQSCLAPTSDCKNAHYIGKTSSCVCFSCENPDKDHLKSICTSDEKAKLELFETEAASRKPDIRTDKFLPAWRDSVTALKGVMKVSREN